ncbi:MAG: ROK family protein [Candidatus Marinimicrobia bacterium]|nr:ROK family protein [Candidatus Neomarinimicrobiota bacterium]
MSKVRKKNIIRRNLILRALLDEERLSLTDLKNKTGISLPVVTSIVSSLEKEKFVTEVDVKDENRGAGRPPLIYQLNGQAGYVLGIDIGRSTTDYVVLDLAQNIIHQDRRESVNLNSKDISVIDDLFDEVQDVIKNAAVKYKSVLGIGISIPGIIQGPKGLSQTYFNFSDESLEELLKKKFNKSVNIEHDAKAMALGELWFGQAKGKQNVLCINIGWGLGLGMILNGKIFYGSDYYAGEFGHLQVVRDGNLCYCGKQGCLETYASGKAMARIAREKIEAGAQTIITNEVNDIEKIDAKVVFESANKGDTFSIEILEEAAGHLGFGLSQIINILNPEMIIFGGKIATVNDFIINNIRAAALKYSMTQINKNIKFVVSDLGTIAGAMGAAMLEFRELFEVEHLNPKAYV